MNITVTKPWGSYTIIQQNRVYCFRLKEIIVNPFQQLSLQKHKDRKEVWIVTSGLGLVTIGESKCRTDIEHIFEINYDVVHCVHNISNEPLKIVELQTGLVMCENDIIRIDDPYKRNSNSDCIHKSTCPWRFCSYCVYKLGETIQAQLF